MFDGSIVDTFFKKFNHLLWLWKHHGRWPVYLLLPFSTTFEAVPDSNSKSQTYKIRGGGVYYLLEAGHGSRDYLPLFSI